MSYSDKVSPSQVQKAVSRGFKRLANFRHARMLFLRNFTGAYYDRASGNIGNESLNLIFNAVRILVPNIVLAFPKHTVTTPYLQAKEYGDMLGLALEQHDKSINIRDIYRRVIVDAIFTLGIMKSGLAQSNSIYAINDEDQIDSGTIYTEAVDFDNFVVDPNSKEHLFRDAAFLGDRITLPRRMLLDSGLYNNEYVERLPRAGTPHRDKAYELSMRGIQADENADLEDQVEVVELWIPSANAIVTVPGADEITFDDYLRVDDYYGVREGPYTLLTLTPPVPGNPLPIPSVGIWNDLHVQANKMAKKILEQAERQKDITFYKRAAADDAEEIKNAGDGEAIAVDDPSAISMQSFGGQQNSNESHLAQLQGWFNMMAGNPNQVGGNGIDAKSATAATLLQQNAGIGLEDMKDMVYVAAAQEARRRAWYFHTDPLMQLPLIRRQPSPAQFAQGPTGPIMVAPPMMQDVQVILTPEMRNGDFFDFTFDIQPESMGRRDSRTRFAQALDFATKIMPSAMGAAQAAMALGIPFSAKAFILRMGKDAGIDWLDEVFYDPEFQQQLLMQQMMGPQAQESKGQAAPAQQPLQSNGQMATLPFNAPPAMQDRQAQQEGANAGQASLHSNILTGLHNNNPIPAFG